MDLEATDADADVSDFGVKFACVGVAKMEKGVVSESLRIRNEESYQ